MFAGSMGNSGKSGTSSPSVATNNSDLNAKIQSNGSGVYITNLENVDWSGCEFGINGQWVALFSSPQYSTQVLFTVKAGQKKFIPFSSMTDKNALIFDPTTHAMNTFAFICFANSGDIRFYNGSMSSN